MAMTRDARFSGVGEAIESYMRGQGLVLAGRRSMVGAIWPEVVGPWYAKHTEVIRAENGVVTVWCDSAARAQQLQLDSADIIKALNKRLGSRTVKELRPSSGGIRQLSEVLGVQPPPGPAPAEIARMELTDEERQAVEAASADLENPALRRAFQSVLSKELRTARWKREHGYVPCPGCGALVPPGTGACKGCDPGRIPMQGSDDVLPDYDSKREATW